MKRIALTLSLLSMLVLGSSDAKANDIEDFFKSAIRGSSRRYDDHDRRGSRSNFRGRGYDSHRGHDHDDRYRGRSSRSSRDRSSLYVSIGLNNSRPGVGYGPRVVTVPPRPVIVAPRPAYPIYEAPAPSGPRFPLPPAPVYRNAIPVTPVRVLPAPRVPVVPHHDFHFGDFATCPVPMFTRVRVKDRDNIHPHARHVVIAVRNPNACKRSCSCCTEPVFVEICVPPCPIRDVDVSRDGTRIELDYGDYEVDITSRNGVVTVDYDD